MVLKMPTDTEENLLIENRTLTNRFTMIGESRNVSF